MPRTASVNALVLIIRIESETPAWGIWSNPAVSSITLTISIDDESVYIFLSESSSVNNASAEFARHRHLIPRRSGSRKSRFSSSAGESEEVPFRGTRYESLCHVLLPYISASDFSLIFP